MPRLNDDDDDDNNNNNNSSDDNEVVSKEEGEEARGRMKKGPWTVSEDITLREHVMKYGEGNWNSVQKNSGLARCGKSCRLRWANHLRPNLKKGALSKGEEQIIVQLHAKLGNKWARMAAQLPGRTDNEIKNFWNTRVKRCQRVGLPLYPPEVLHEANVYHLLQQHLTQSYTSSSFSFSPFLSSSYRQEINELSHPSSVNTQQNLPDSCHYTNPLNPQFKFPNEKSANGNVVLPLSLVSPYGSSPSSLFNQSFTVNNSHDCHSGSYNYGFNPNAAMPSSPYESPPLMQGSNTEASLSQSPPSSTTPTSSYASGIYGLMGGASSMVNNGCYEVAPLSPRGNSGLLDSLVVEAQSLCRNGKSKSEASTTSEVLSQKRKSIVTEECAKKDDIVIVGPGTKSDGNTTNKIRRVDLNSSQFSTGNKQIVEDGLEGINSMDDDLFGLLNNFQGMPVPDWYHKGGQPLGLETQRDASLGPIDQEFATHENLWRNMPNIR